MDNQLEGIKEDTNVVWPFYREETTDKEKRQEDKQELGKAYYRLAKLYYDKADINKAEKYFLNSYHCTEVATDYFPMLKILGFLIRIASEKLDNEKAQDYIQKCKILLDKITTLEKPLNSEYFYNMGFI